MTTKSKENLSWFVDISRETLWDTKASLSLLEKETWINFFKTTREKLKNLFEYNWKETQNLSTTIKSTNKIETIWWDKISDEMFQQLLKMEWDQNFVAKTATYFGEKFTTWPYGMVYKHIDSNWNILKRPIPFKENERVSKQRAENNARVYYNKRAKEWSNLLKSKWYKYSQNMLDALTSVQIKLLKQR